MDGVGFERTFIVIRVYIVLYCMSFVNPKLDMFFHWQFCQNMLISPFSPFFLSEFSFLQTSKEELLLPGPPHLLKSTHWARFGALSPDPAEEEALLLKFSPRSLSSFGLGLTSMVCWEECICSSLRLLSEVLGFVALLLVLLLLTWCGCLVGVVIPDGAGEAAADSSQEEPLVRGWSRLEAWVAPQQRPL